MNQCGRCGIDFGSVSAFDKHRVGVFDYSFAQGLDMEPPRENGRRCLGEDEFAKVGLIRNSHSSWSIGKDLERVRRVFAGG